MPCIGLCTQYLDDPILRQLQPFYDLTTTVDWFNHNSWIICDLYNHTGQTKSTGKCYNPLVLAFFFVHQSWRKCYTNSQYIFLSERNSTLLMMSPGARTIDKVAVYGFATNFNVDTECCILTSSLMIAEFKTVAYILACFPPESN